MTNTCTQNVTREAARCALAVPSLCPTALSSLKRHRNDIDLCAQKRSNSGFVQFIQYAYAAKQVKMAPFVRETPGRFPVAVSKAKACTQLPETASYVLGALTVS